LIGDRSSKLKVRSSNFRCDIIAASWGNREAALVWGSSPTVREGSITNRCLINAKDAKSFAKHAKARKGPQKDRTLRYFAITFATFAFQIYLITRTHLSHLYDAALALVYPQACAVCGSSIESRHDGVACASCWRSTRLFDEKDTMCWKCGMFTEAAVSEDKRMSIRCGGCADDMFTAARACGFYEGALRASVLELKRQPHVASRLARLMLVTLQRPPLDSANLIIPVPLHPERERERGFNQAVLLARELARLSRLPLDEHSVVRRVHTERHRAGMDARARRESVGGAFAIRHPKLVAGQRVLLVDDVFTTGATVSACAAALGEAGAEDVFVLTVARPQPY
jgi:competence protein ComFC